MMAAGREEIAMRYVMLTYQGDEHLAAWEAASPEERRAEVERTIAWFRAHAATIVGGEELGLVSAPGRSAAAGS